MTTYNTGNALGSSDARDLYDNAENIDNFANGAANTYQDRLGVTRKSLAGMNAAFNDFIESSGYTLPVLYGAGIVLSQYNQLIEYNGEFYKPKAGQVPYTTTGTWGTDSAKLVAVGDAALRQDLAVPGGSALVGADDGASGSLWTTVAGFIAFLRSSLGASIVGFIQAGAGAVSESIQKVLRQRVTVTQFGAVGGGVTDDTDAFKRAILFLALRGGGRLIAPFDTYKILGKVLLPENVEIDLCGSTLVGSGLGFDGSGATVTGTGTMFETGYLDGGVMLTNIGTANESHLVTGLRVHGGTIKNVGTAFNLFNFNWQSAITGIQFENVGAAVKAKRSWYGKFHELISLFDAGGTTEAAFQFADFVNVENITSCFVTGRKLGFKFSGGINGLLLSTNSVEGCDNGMLFEGEINPIKIDCNYFESITGTAIDMTHASAKRAVTINNNWFYTVGTAIAGVGMTGGEIGDGNYFDTVTTKVSITDNASTIRVRIPQRFIADNTTLAPASASSIGYQLGPNIDLVWRSTVFDDATGRAIISTLSTGQTVDLPYYGYVDYVPGTVPFCTVSPYAGGVDIDTSIFASFVASGPIVLRITDDGGTKNFYGQFYGTNVAMASSVAGATVTAYNSGGKLRINVAGLSGTPSVVEGIIRLA